MSESYIEPPISSRSWKIAEALICFKSNSKLKGKAKPSEYHSPAQKMPSRQKVQRKLQAVLHVAMTCVLNRYK